MNKRNALTLVEVLVIIGVMVFLLAIVMPILELPRGPHPKRHYCLMNLKDLGIAWIMYADDNDGKLVNGQPGVNANGILDTDDDRPTINNRVEIPWARGIEIDPATGDPKISRRDQEQLIKGGALWPYIKNTKVYRCPDGKANHMRTYSIVCSLNGDKSPVAGSSDAEMLCVKHRSLVRRPHDRIVFVDEGWINNSSFRIGYTNPGTWIDPPPARHRGGMTFVFADCHSGYWKWKGKGTVKAGEKRIRDYAPVSSEDREDLRDMRMAVWGEIP
jgi:prepilin-type processing-associated H-X9-DG protein